MKEVQGYVTIIPNDPSGRGMLYFTEDGAREQAIRLNKMVEQEWETPGKFNKDYWKEKPLPCKVYSLIIKEELNYEALAR